MKFPRRCKYQLFCFHVVLYVFIDGQEALQSCHKKLVLKFCVAGG